MFVGLDLKVNTWNSFGFGIGQHWLRHIVHTTEQ